MSAELSLTPFEQLQAIERKCQSRAAGLPAQEETKEQWTGVLFRLRGNDLLAPMSDVAEIVSLPDVARVPGVKPWVMGVANMRGNLLPVMDLTGLLYGEASAADAKTRRLLVIKNEAVFAGLLVDAILGMKHFWVDEQDETPPSLGNEIDPYIDGSYSRLGERYAIFSLSRLATSEAFMNVVAL
ncbi:MAG: chemotaxis protein CheW [Chromatiales bacterium]|jgi:twitching motility protein PilI